MLCAVPRYDASYSDDRTVGLASISKHIGERGSVYFTYSTGYKAGGINLTPNQAVDVARAVFSPETVTSYELGYKQSLLDNRLSLRSALYRMDYKDVQLYTFDGLGSYISNAASARSQGLELEAGWRIAPGLRFTLGYAYSDAKYGNDTQVTGLAGKQLTNAPKNSGNVGFDWNLPMSWANLFGSINARYQSGANTGSDLAPQKYQPGYSLMNARIGLRFRNDLETSFWVSNLTDASYNQIVINAVVQGGSFQAFPGAPRTFGIDVRKNF